MAILQSYKNQVTRTPTPVPTPTKSPARQTVISNPKLQSGYGPQYGQNPQNYSSGQVLGSTTGGGYAVPSGGAPQQQSSAPMESVPEQPSIDFDALIRPALEALDAYVTPLQSGFAQFQTQTEGERSRDVQRLGVEQKQQESDIETARTRQQRIGESAADEARRQFSEIQQGIQGLYGGTTGTGAFASELAGRDTMKNISNIRQGISEAMGELDNKLFQVREVGKITLQDIEDKARDRIAQAKNQLELNLADIRRQKGELQARKAELAMNAMQTYQQTVNEVNARNTAFKQQVYLQQQQAEQALQAAMNKGRQAVQSYEFKTYNPAQETPVAYNKTTGEARVVTTPGGGALSNQVDQGIDLSTFDPTREEQQGVLGMFGL